MSKIDFKEHLEQGLVHINRQLAAAELSAARREILERDSRRTEAALDRMRHQRFGICCDCGDPMGEEWLAVDPAAPFCEDCQDARMAA